METVECDRFMTVANVARFLNVSKPTVIALIRQGELPAVRIGKVFRVATYGVDDYLDRAGINLNVIRGCPQPSTARAAPVSSSVQTAERDPATGVNVS